MAPHISPTSGSRKRSRHRPKKSKPKQQPMNFGISLLLIPFYFLRLPTSAQPSRKRLLMVWSILMVCTLGLALNLFKLQVLQAGVLKQKAQDQQWRTVRPFVPRRPIVDRQGNVLAVDQSVETLYAHPKLFQESKEEIATKLAGVLGRPAIDIFQQLNAADSGIRLEYSVPEAVANRIESLQLDGLELIPHQQRFYPQQDLMAEVVGYIDSDRQGQAGLEYSRQNLLERSVPTGRMAQIVRASAVPDAVPQDFLHLDDLRLELTIDSRIQRAGRSALQKKMQEFHAKRGTVMVMDVRDGSILALVSEPSYDPNRYYDFDLQLFKNWALTDLYEPGSTFKPLIVAIALEAGAIQIDSVFNDDGNIYVDGWPIQNADGGGHGAINVTEIVQYSSNVGMVQIAQQMQPGVFYNWLQRLGLGQTSGIDLPFEEASSIRSRQDFLASPVNPATTAFGQGIALTPIQLLQMHAALANGGKLLTPHITRGLFTSKGEPHWQPSLPAPRQVFSPETSQALMVMMEQVVDDGTGKAAQIPGYRIGGKTGTAQKASEGGGYSDYAKITSFVGVFPVEAPRYVVLAVVDEPRGGSGGLVAAPVVKSVMEALISVEGIPPSKPVKAPKDQK